LGNVAQRSSEVYKVFHVLSMLIEFDEDAAGLAKVFDFLRADFECRP